MAMASGTTEMRRWREGIPRRVCPASAAPTLSQARDLSIRATYTRGKGTFPHWKSARPSQRETHVWGKVLSQAAGSTYEQPSELPETSCFYHWLKGTLVLECHRSAQQSDRRQ